MDLKTLYDTPSWEWPEDAGIVILNTLRDDRIDASDRLTAVALASDVTVIDDEMVEALLSILRDGKAPDDLRGRAAVALGPALEYVDTELLNDDGSFEEPSAVPVSERAFRKIQQTLHQFYRNAETPKIVRRRVLEAAVRAPQDWHVEAIRAAYSATEEDWKLTAVFCMQYVRGFDDLILDSLARENPEILYEAVCAAGNWELDAAWPRISGLIAAKGTDKHLLLAAIDAAAVIRPTEAPGLLYDLMFSKDEDIVAAVHEALAMADADEWQGDDEDDDW
ncbi:MAG: hypothetical protein WAK95_19775 [Desulfobacterales bacterium]